MKYVDKFFTLPIRVSKVSLRRGGMDLRLDEDETAEVTVDWVRGVAKIPFEEIKGWYDSFSDEREVDDVAEKGFDITIVETHTMGEFECSLPMAKFEKLYEKFAQVFFAEKEKRDQELMDLIKTGKITFGREHDDNEND